MRLIDADKLMEYCQNLKERKIDCNDIARFPTAYDVDKVIEELVNYKNYVIRNSVMGIDAISKAIEIVKGGETNDD